MPVFFRFKHLPDIFDKVIDINIGVFCIVAFSNDERLQLEKDNTDHVKVNDVVIGYDLSESLASEGCIRLILLRNNNKKYYITVYCQLYDSELLKLKNRELKYKRTDGIKDILS
jgi:hypothetical protein